MNTPRTDAFISKFYGNRSLSSGSRHRTDVELHDFARQLERELAAAQAEIAALRNFVDKNMTFYDVDAAALMDSPNIPVLAHVSNRIWYHATDNTKSYQFSAVIDAAIKEDD